MQVSYVANHGVHLGVAQNINLPPALGLGTAGEPEYNRLQTQCSDHGKFSRISSNYQSLQLQLNRRFNGGLGVINSFTWGKGLGYQTPTPAIFTSGLISGTTTRPTITITGSILKRASTTCYRSALGSGG